ncbi:hypothetical protein [Aeoliella sp.]|uniref:hypothetical protein n=1 Tax=Aeoliella sp. TaxID=2795800 RepID=UPI003CCBAF77
MNTLRNSKALAVFGMLAVALAVTLVSAPSADAGCHGYGYRYTTYHAPIVKHYVAPVKVVKVVTPTYIAPPCYTPTYYAPTYVAPTFNYGYGW